MFEWYHYDVVGLCYKVQLLDVWVNAFDSIHHHWWFHPLRNFLHLRPHRHLRRHLLQDNEMLLKDVQSLSMRNDDLRSLNGLKQIQLIVFFFYFRQTTKLSVNRISIFIQRGYWVTITVQISLQLEQWKEIWSNQNAKRMHSFPR